MNFLEMNYQMIEEVVSMRTDLKTGKISLDNYVAQMGGMGTIGKMMDRHMRILAFEQRYKVSLRNAGKGLIGYNPDGEKIRCPGNKKDITRGKCLDFSGQDPPKFEKCDGCEFFGSTRKLLLPEK